jgi:hypothetical protein
MAKAGDRDAALLLDMLLAAKDARGFAAGMDEAAFLASRLHQNAVIRSLEVIGEAASKVSPAFRAAQPNIPGVRSSACATGSSTATTRCGLMSSGARWPSILTR